MNYKGEVFFFLSFTDACYRTYFSTAQVFFLIYNSLFVIFFRWRSASAVKRAMEDKVRCIISINKALLNEKNILAERTRWRKHCYPIHVPSKQFLRIIFPRTECFSPRYVGSISGRCSGNAPALLSRKGTKTAGTQKRPYVGGDREALPIYVPNLTLHLQIQPSWFRCCR